MRIGMFTDCYPPVQNGISVSVDTLVTELRERRHRVLLVAPHHPEQDDRSPFVVRVPSIWTMFNPYPLAYPMPPAVSRRLGRVPPHVIHSHNPFILGRLALQLARQSGVPLVSTYHTLYHHYAHYLVILPPRAVDNLLEWLLPDYYNQCACVLAPSRIAEQSLRKYGVTARVRVVPTGVPLPPADALTQRAQLQARKQHNIPAAVPFLLFVGRIAPEKNVDMVVGAFDRVAAEHPNLRLVLAGTGPYLDACRKRAGEMPTADRIHFVGAVDHGSLPSLYAAAELFVFGSSTETQGLVVAEARAAGCPCVVVDEGGAGETVADGEDGCVTRASEEAFAAAIRGLLANRERLVAMRERCLANAPQFTPQAMADKVLDEYRTAIDSHVPPPREGMPDGP